MGTKQVRKIETHKHTHAFCRHTLSRLKDKLA